MKNDASRFIAVIAYPIVIENAKKYLIPNSTLKLLDSFGYKALPIFPDESPQNLLEKLMGSVGIIIPDCTVELVCEEALSESLVFIFEYIKEQTVSDYCFLGLFCGISFRLLVNLIASRNCVSTLKLDSNNKATFVGKNHEYALIPPYFCKKKIFSIPLLGKDVILESSLSNFDNYFLETSTILTAMDEKVAVLVEWLNLQVVGCQFDFSVLYENEENAEIKSDCEFLVDLIFSNFNFGKVKQEYKLVDLKEEKLKVDEKEYVAYE